MGWVTLVAALLVLAVWSYVLYQLGYDLGHSMGRSEGRGEAEAEQDCVDDFEEYD